MGVRWRKVLYETQPFPDNYCGPQFLQGLKSNVTARVYTYAEACSGALVLCHRIALVFVFATTFVLVSDTDSDAAQSPAVRRHAAPLVAAVALCAALIYAGLVVVWKKCGARVPFRAHCSTVAVVVSFGYASTPILLTLADSISTDTIYAMAVAMFIGHLFFAHYGLDVAIVSRPVSLNMAVFGAVCLQSRLHSSTHAFALLMLAILLFALWPYAQEELLHCGADQCVAWLHFAVSLFSLLFVCAASLWWAAAATITLLCITFVCPALLVAMQPLKNTIHGPWDEAMIKEHQLQQSPKEQRQ